jgi:hypothetical protein
MSAQLHLSTDILNGWPASLPAGVTFAPAISRFPDDRNVKPEELAHVWPAAPNDAWAQRILSLVPADFTGLVMLDNEGPQTNALWAPLGKIIDPAKRKASVTALCHQLDALKRARPRAAFGFYGVPSGGWYSPPMYAQTRRHAEELSELYRHLDVIMPSVYCTEDTPGHEGFAEFIMNMASKISRKYGVPLAPVVATRIYANGDEKAVLIGERVLKPWMKTIMKHRPEHLVYWHNEPWFVANDERKKLKRHLTEEELGATREQAKRNVAWALRFFQGYTW